MLAVIKSKSSSHSGSEAGRIPLRPHRSSPRTLSSPFGPSKDRPRSSASSMEAGVEFFEISSSEEVSEEVCGALLVGLV